MYLPSGLKHALHTASFNSIVLASLFKSFDQILIVLSKLVDTKYFGFVGLNEIDVIQSAWFTSVKVLY